MRTQSSSSLSTYLKCPFAYKLNYLDGIKGKPTAKMEYGSWIEEQIFSPKPHKDAKAFIDAFHEWLGDDEVIETQKHIEFQLGSYKYQGFLDFVTAKGIAGEIKVTGSPAYYQSLISYQTRIYSLGLKKLGYYLRPEYLLFEIDSKQKFKTLHLSQIVTTNLLDDESSSFLDQVCHHIEEDEKVGIFTPSYNGCGQCLWKDNCEHYFGY